MLLTVAAFLVALGLLIAIHEFGHYQVARWCGVKILRFSIGFGKPLLRWTSHSTGTEFVLSSTPPALIQKVCQEMDKVTQSAKFQAQLKTQGFDAPQPSTMTELQQKMLNTVEQNRKILSKLRIASN